MCILGLWYYTLQELIYNNKHAPLPCRRTRRLPVRLSKSERASMGQAVEEQRKYYPEAWEKKNAGLVLLAPDVTYTLITQPLPKRRAFGKCQ